MYINGNWIEEAEEKIEVENPATGKVFDEVPMGNEEDADRAVAAANEAFDDWKNLTGGERASHLDKVVESFEANQEKIARKLTQEQGKPLSEARGEVSASIKAFRYYARKARDIKGEIYPTESNQVRSFVIKQPVGPVAAISPWN
mgnify:CR=1 FL=1